VRFGECDLRCAWCDSPGTWRRSVSCRLEIAPGAAVFRELDNPIDEATISDTFETLDVSNHRFVSLTGGEPLLQPDAVIVVAEMARARGASPYLETHGLAMEAMAQVAPHIDVVAMDWKLASDVRRAGEARGALRGDFHDEHEGFLRAAANACEVFVKVVVTPTTREAELDEVCRRIESIAPQTPLVLQPVTPCGSVHTAPDPESMLRYLRRASTRLPDVRLVPQTHKQLQVL
jgi:7-carboxy-7-deazaguanine synthase